MRKFIVILAAMFMAATTVQAGSIGGRSGGFSSSRSISSSSYSAPKVSTPSYSGGISGGKSVGMSRPDVVAKVAPKPVAPAPSAAPAYSYRPAAAAAAPAVSAPAAHAPVAAVSSSPGLGSTFLASAGGGLVGSMLGNAISGNHGGGTTVVNNGGPGGPSGSSGGSLDPSIQPAAGALAAAAPTSAHAASPVMSSWSWAWEILGAIFLIAILVSAAIIGYRLVKRLRKSAAEEKWRERMSKLVNDPLPFGPVARFHAVQDAYFSGSPDPLRDLLGPNMLAQALKSAPLEPRETSFASISYEVADRSENMISIHFRGHDLLDDTQINELWHFAKIDDQWLLEGIDQV